MVTLSFHVNVAIKNMSTDKINFSHQDIEKIPNLMCLKLLLFFILLIKMHLISMRMWREKLIPKTMNFSVQELCNVSSI